MQDRFKLIWPIKVSLRLLPLDKNLSAKGDKIHYFKLISKYTEINQVQQAFRVNM